MNERTNKQSLSLCSCTIKRVVSILVQRVQMNERTVQLNERTNEQIKPSTIERRVSILVQRVRMNEQTVQLNEPTNKLSLVQSNEQSRLLYKEFECTNERFN